MRATRIKDANASLMAKEIDADTFLRRVTFKDFYLTTDFLNLDFDNDDNGGENYNDDDVELSEQSPGISEQSPGISERSPSPVPNGFCIICREKGIEIVLVPCGHCLCSLCWKILFKMHKKKHMAADPYEFNDDDDSDDEFLPGPLVNIDVVESTMQLRTNRRRIVKEILESDDDVGYPNCQYCNARTERPQRLFLVI